MTEPSSPADDVHADPGDPDRERPDLADEAPVQLDEDAIRERAEHDDDEATDSLL